jgi:hypothetical protein
LVPVKDIKVDAQADPKAKFSGYKTYTWLGTAAILNDPDGKWEPRGFDADAEIKFLVDRELRKRGMSENLTNPDLAVGFALGVDMDALGLKVDPKTKMDVLQNVPQAALLLALVDVESGFVIYVGAATAEIQENVDEKTAKARLDYAVTQLIQKIPE